MTTKVEKQVFNILGLILSLLKMNYPPAKDRWVSVTHGATS